MVDFDPHQLLHLLSIFSFNRELKQSERLSNDELVDRQDKNFAR